MSSGTHKQSFGIIASPSTTSRISIIAAQNDGSLLPVVGHLAYFDSIIDGITYRAIGTITDMQTGNALGENMAMKIAVSKGGTNINNSSDVRTTQLIVQSVFSFNGDDWKQYASALPNSPTTGSQVYLLTEDTIKEMLQNTSYPSIGYFRGLDAPVPLRLLDFSSSTGAYHTGMVGKSGSGKSSTATFNLAGKMRHEAHAMIVVDPQGQWNNENGFLFSVKAFAEGLGREVHSLRVSEDIKLTRDFETLSTIISKLDLWTKLQRMGDENKEILSDEVTEILVSLRGQEFDKSPREVLSTALKRIALSDSAMARIYASEDRRERLRETLRLMVGLPPLADKNDEVREVTEEEDEDIERKWEAVLSRFTPIHSLFSSTNLSGGKRLPLGGDNGFLKNVLQIRNPENPNTPAPYVVLDMSPDVKLNIKASLDEKNIEFQMKKTLDNEDIKAIIVLSVLEEIKQASEEAFSMSGGNLNTQIVFDEAWRYAPERSDSKEITALSKALGGYARDTRKFGVGWTYILQSPNDLRSDIWKQLTYTYSGYGLVGDDVRMLEALTDDPEQVRTLYRQFIPPTSTGIYPFMITGPESPLIFTASPTFINVFSSIDEFIEHNKKWISDITRRRSKKMITGNNVQVVKVGKKKTEQPVTKTYGVGKVIKRPDTQIAPAQKTVNKPVDNSFNDVVENPPF